MNRPSVRLAVAAAGVVAFTVPVFGGRPVPIMILSQAISPVIMPVLIILIFILLNDRRICGDYRNPLTMNIGLLISLGFALLISYSAFLGLWTGLRS